MLGLSLRRLAGDMQREQGYGVLLAESFVDRARFAGTCYRAANWRSLGFTGGYARQPGAVPEWRHHGQPKEVLVYELEADARAALGPPEEDPAWQGPERTAPPPAPELRSLFDCLGEVEDYRCARGQRYRLRTVLVLAMAARLAGYRGVTACAQFAAPAGPVAAAGGGLFLQSQPALLHDPVERDVPQHPGRPAAGDTGARGGGVDAAAERASPAG